MRVYMKFSNGLKLTIAVVALICLTYLVFIAPPLKSPNGQDALYYCKNYAKNYTMEPVPINEKRDAWGMDTTREKEIKAKADVYDACISNATIDYAKLSLYGAFIIFCTLIFLFMTNIFSQRPRSIS